MTITTEQKRKVVAAWQAAGRELGIEVVAPYEFHGARQIHQCVAYLPHFGRPKGIVLQGYGPPDYEPHGTLSDDAKSAGLYCSIINVEVYKDFDREKFIEALADWGFYGDPEQRPAWLE